MFVHVTGAQQAIAWYSTLLGVPQRQASHGGLIYDVPMASPIEDIGGVGVFHLSDPDGNRLIVYARN